MALAQLAPVVIVLALLLLMATRVDRHWLEQQRNLQHSTLRQFLKRFASRRGGTRKHAASRRGGTRNTGLSPRAEHETQTEEESEE